MTRHKTFWSNKKQIKTWKVYAEENGIEAAFKLPQAKLHDLHTLQHCYIREVEKFQRV